MKVKTNVKAGKSNTNQFSGALVQLIFANQAAGDSL
jgi:hypothetical protein